jgi:multidrug efflux system outer membrane protein
MKKMIYASLIGASALTLLGCAQQPTYSKPQVEWPNTMPALDFKSLASEQAWWAQFADEQLNEWIRIALQNNADYAIAQQRMQQASLALSQVRGGLLPNAALEVGAANQQTSDQTYPVGTGANFNSFNVNALLSYELDLWGRVASSIKRAEAEYQARAFDQQARRLSLVSQVAQGYFQIRALEQMIEIAKQTVISRKETLALREQQYALGRLTQLAVHQAEVELTRVEIQAIQLQHRLDQQRHALSVLLGETPRAMLARSKAELGDGGFEQTQLPTLPMNLSSELLLRRPDIQAAEQRLLAANAQVGVARASLFPKVSFNASVGLGSESLADWFDPDAGQYRLQAGLFAPIFNSGALQAQVKITESEQNAQLIAYHQAIRVAFAEALDALSQQQRSQQQALAQQRQVNALNQALSLAQTRFDAGYSSYLEVLDAQRHLFDAELALVTSKLSALQASLQLYKALGGDWQA